MKNPIALATTTALLFAVGCASAQSDVATAEQPVDARLASDAASERPDRDGFDVFVSPADVVSLQDAGAVVIDVRAPEEYAEAHIPGSINIPGNSLRTPSAKPGLGDSQYIFRDADGGADIAKYEQILGDAGLTRGDTVVVYGNHAGKGDGSVPAMLLDFLGQEEVHFLDGVGMSEWYAAGHEVSTDSTTRDATTYTAEPREGFLWNLDDVVAHVGDGSAIFYDTRSVDEFNGKELRDNARGGRIPGAVHADYAELLDDQKRVLPREQVEEILEAQGLPAAKAAGKPIVLYCQTSTRVSLPYLVLRELGYDTVAVYDASWHEYGNREDTPIDGETRASAE